MATTKKETIVKKTTGKGVIAKEVKQSSVGETQSKIATLKQVQGKLPRNDGGLSVPVYSLLGKVSGEIALPKDIFGAKVNASLLSQAVRVYSANLKGHHSNTKTRGEVEGSTRKIYAQKGTGRARHGGIRAPIFVGGGIALGPRTRKISLELPQKMRVRALVSALAQKALDNSILGISGLEKATGKSKEIAQLLKKIEKKNVLIVADKNMENAYRAIKNVTGINFITADAVNVYQVVSAKSLVLTKEAVDRLEDRLKMEAKKSE